MKRNWTLIVSLIALLIAYDVFILRPYNAKQAALRKANAPQKVETSNPQAQTSEGISTQNTQAPTEALAETTTPQENEGFAVVGSLNLGPNRSAEVLANGGVRNAVFKDYFVRGREQKEPVHIMQEGLAWGSTNPEVKRCLSALKLNGDLRFVATVDGVSCEVLYGPATSVSGLHAAELTIRGLKTFSGSVYLEFVSRLGEGDRFDFKALDFKLNGEKEHIQGEDVFETQVFKGKMDWASWGDKYFTTIFLPKGTFNPDFALTAVDAAEVAKEKRRFRMVYQYPLVDMGTEALKFEGDLYIGTKDLSVLKKIRPDLVEAVDMGWFSSVGHFMLWCLEQLNRFLGNFGWSIIALTVLVRLVFWPLNRRVFESGQKMKDLQPKIEALRKKYGTDRSQMEQMNREMMALYRTEKVNPLGSCLPLLLQMPIFIGLYGSLSNAIDLYQSPFIFWIEDLSYKDPFYVLPVLWTISLLLMMKFTPQPTINQPGMPDMKKVMFVMYFVFGFMAKDWPSGLCLYLVVSSFLGTFQQFLFRRSQAKLQPVQEGA